MTAEVSKKELDITERRTHTAILETVGRAIEKIMLEKDRYYGSVTIHFVCDHPSMVRVADGGERVWKVLNGGIE